MKITVIGLGYVGLPLARLFATKYAVIGFDVNPIRIAELRNCNDNTLEVSEELLKTVIISNNPQKNEKGLFFTADLEDIKDSNIYIVTVPTPVDKNNKPDFYPLYSASELVGKVLKKNDIVIYESTVFPGATEEECVPVLEKFSGLKFNQDFFVGYSPERINPGDKEHTVEKILKITSGSTPEIAEKVDKLYQSVLLAGTHLAPSIKVAEAAKVIENTQRDVNIAFVNELSKIFNLIGIDTHEVLKAAGTKWNFLPFKPGLVGGHCTGVDPYYLAHKAIEFDLPEVIFFASGVSNSSEISEKEFNREENLIHKILGDNPQKQFVYFSTCSIYDSSKNGSPYVLHKLKMEQIIINKASNYLILRVSNAVGKGGNPNLLMNYIYSSILNKKKITIHKNAKRNLIDVEDVVKISHNIISNNIKNKIINIAFKENIAIENLVNNFEKILKTKTEKEYIEIGESYSIDIQNIKAYFRNTDVNNYLENIINKYYK